MNNHPKNLIRTFVTTTLVLLLGASALAAPQDRWYVLQLNGQKAGHAHEATTTNDKGQIVTTEDVVLNLAREMQEIKISMSTEFVENADGSPFSMTQDQNLGLMKGHSVYTFTPEGIKEVSEQAGVKTEKTHPKPEGEWLTPSRIEKLVAERLKAGDSSFSFKSVNPTSGPTATETTVKVLEAGATAEAFGKFLPAVKWEQTNTAMPGTKSVEWVDEHGRPIRTEVVMGGMTLTMIAADKEIALSPFRAPESMAQTTIVPVGNIPAPARNLKEVICTLRTADGKPLPKLPKGGNQRVTPNAKDPSAALVKVDLDWPVIEEAPPNPADLLVATRALNIDDPVIKELTKKALEKAQGAKPIDQAKVLRKFVYDFIQKKDLGVGFATASEVARTKQGDCSEHAVLLAAMLRAAGIPSRTVSGLLYVDQFGDQHNVYAFHMWTQALLTDNAGHPAWREFDATLPNDKVFDAGHIALTNSALNDDDTLNSLATLAQMIGNLKIVIDVAE